MAKYHINHDGDLGVCKSTKGKCPYGGESGNENHYDNIKDATMAFEKRMGNETIPTGLNKNVGGYGESNVANQKSNGNGVKEKTSEKDTVKAKPKKIGLRELNNLAKNPSTDAETLLMAAQSSSDRVHSSLVKNPSAPAEALKMLKNSEDKSVAREALAHSNYPVSALSGEEFASSLTRFNKNARLSSNDVNDEHIEALRKTDNESLYSPTFNSVATALSNPNNKVSSEMVEKVLEETPLNRRVRNRDVVTKSGKVNVDNYLKGKTAHEISFEGLEDSKHENVLNGVTNWVVNNDDDDAESRWSNYKSLQERLVRNPHMSEENLTKIYEKAKKDDNGLVRLDAYREGQIPSGFVSSLHENPNTSENVKRELEEASHYLKTDGDVRRLVEKHPNIAQELISQRNSSRSLNSSRTYNEVTFTIDKEKAKAYGMDSRMISNLYGRGFNAGFSYDDRTGTITGKVDSSD